MSVTLRAELLSVQVKVKKTKIPESQGGGEDIDKIGRLTIEFDGDSVDAAALADLVHERSITLSLENTQRSMFTPAAAAAIDN